MDDLFDTVGAPGFAEFWKIYPKKKGTSRVTAHVAWRRARRGTSIETIMEGLRLYPFSSDPQYQPSATVWLNQARWVLEEDTAPPTVNLVPVANPRPSKGAWMEGFGRPGLFIEENVETGDD